MLNVLVNEDIWDSEMKATLGSHIVESLLLSESEETLANDKVSVIDSRMKVRVIWSPGEN